MSDEILVNIKSILAPRTHGLSVMQIKKEYADLMGTRLQITNDQLVDMLSKCPGITNSYSGYSKQTVYHYKSAQTAHISNMNRSSEAVKQKILRPMNNQHRPRYGALFRRQPAMLPLQPISESNQKPNVVGSKVPDRFVKKPLSEDLKKTTQNQVSETGPPPSFQKELQQIQGSNKENYEPTAIETPNFDSIAAQYHKYTSNFCGRELIGDSFFLSCFEDELGHQQLLATARPQIGFCVSGLTIADALAIADERQSFLYQVVVNLGSTDLLLGNTIDRMGQTYRELVTILDSKGANPIVTTLAPLGTNDSSAESKLKQFNRFLKSMFSTVIDLEMAMRHPTTGRPDPSLYDCCGRDNGVSKWSRKGQRRVLLTLFTYTADCGATRISSTEKEVNVSWVAPLQRWDTA